MKLIFRVICLGVVSALSLASSSVFAQSFSHLTVNGIDAAKQSVRYHDSLIFVTIPADIDIPSSITLSADITDGYYSQPSLSKSNAAKTFVSSFISGYSNSYFEYNLVSNDNTTSKTVRVYIEHPLNGVSSKSSSFVLSNVKSFAKATLLEAEANSCRVGGGSVEKSVTARILESFTPDSIQGPKLVCAGSSAEYSVAGLPGANNVKVVWSVTKGTGYMPIGDAGDIVEKDAVVEYTGKVLTLSTPSAAGKKANISVHISLSGANSSECVSANLGPLAIESRQGAPLDVTSFIAGCVTDDGHLVISAVSPTSSTASDPVSYSWNFLPKYVNNLVESSDFNSVVLNLGTADAPKIQATVFVENSCGVGEDPKTMYVDYIARTSTWTGTADSDWSNRDNWTGGVPGSCTDVYINAVGAGADFYPVIDKTDNAACNTIHFQPEAGVVGLQYLDYNKAYVSVSMTRDKWYALSSPLQEMRSADFYYYGSPLVHMKKFNCETPGSKGYVFRGSWTSAFNSITEVLSPVSGYVAMANSASNSGAISSNNLIVTLPREDGNGDLVNTSYMFNPLTGRRLSKAYALNKDESKAYRFAFEGLQESEGSSQISIPVNVSSAVDTLQLVPNPVMAHLNPKKFYAANKEYISPNLRLWDGINNTFYTLNAATGVIGGKSNVLIAPFQSFVVDATSSSSFNLKMNMDTDFSADTDGSNRLRSDSNDYPFLLSLEKTSNGEASSVVVSLWSDATSDASLDEYSSKDHLFYTGRLTTEMYYLDGVHKGDIKAVRSTAVIPLGFDRVAETHEVEPKLTISGADKFPDTVGVFLVNTVSGEEYNLRDESSFNLPDTLYNDGDLQIELRRLNATLKSDPVMTVSDIENSDSNFNIFTIDNTVRFSASKSEPVSQIAIFDETGRLITRRSYPGVQSASVQLNSGLGSIIVRVTTANSVKSEKVFIK